MRPAPHISEAVHAWLESKKGELLDFIRQLARMESPSSDPKALQAILDWLGEQMKQRGMYVLRVPGRQSGGYLYARPARKAKGQPVQLLLGHADTVWPLQTLQEMPLEETGTRLSGPGVYDMKAGIAQVYFALYCLSELSLTQRSFPWS